MGDPRTWASGRALAHNQRIPQDTRVKISRLLDDRGRVVTTLTGRFKGQAVVSPKASILLDRYDVRFEKQNASREDGVMILEVDPTVVEVRRMWRETDE